MKLSDKQLVILSTASQHAELIVLPTSLKDAPAKAAASRLLKSRLLEEISVNDRKNSWRIGKDGQPLGLRITNLGLNAIQVDEGASRLAAKASDTFKKTPQTTPPRKGAPGKSKVPAERSKSGAGGSGSKQDDILALLRKRGGTTLDALVKATGWQRHSVRGFLAGTIRGKLKLPLLSEQVDGIRTYKIGAKRKGTTARAARRAS